LDISNNNSILYHSTLQPSTL